MRKSLALSALVLLGGIEAYAVSLPTPSYTVTDIGVLPGYRSIRGSSINVLGQVTGTCSDGTSPLGFSHTFLYQGGKLTDLGQLYINYLNATTGTFLDAQLFSQGLMINIQGEVVFLFSAPDAYEREGSLPVLYRNGSFTTLFAYPNGYGGDVTGLNDFGQIAGGINLGIGADPIFTGIERNYYSYITQPNGAFVILPDYGPPNPVTGNPGNLKVQGLTDWGQAYGFVETGSTTQIAGSTNNLVEELIVSAYGQRVKLGTVVEGGLLVFNQRGDFVDQSKIVMRPGNPVPFFPPVLHVGNKTIQLDPPPGTAALTNPVYTTLAINDFDTVVGYLTDSASGATLPFLYFKGQIYDPNTLVSTSLHIDELVGINDAGQILANAFDPVTGYGHTLILNPRSR
jgi:probable HAF family extracellular repeat protein